MEGLVIYGDELHQQTFHYKFDVILTVHPR